MVTAQLYEICDVCVTEVLPLVQFQLEAGITDAEAARLLEMPGSQAELWTQQVDEHSQSLRLDETSATVPDPFTAHLLSFEVGTVQQQ